MRGPIAALLPALVVLAVACQRDRDRAVEDVVEHAIAAGGREATVTIDRERGSITVDLGAATRPKRWPTTVPMYPHASRAKVEGDLQEGRRLVLTSDRAGSEIADYYRSALSADGWAIEGDALRGMHARRGAERLDLTFSKGREPGTTRTELAYAPGAG